MGDEKGEGRQQGKQIKKNWRNGGMKIRKNGSKENGK